MERIHRDYPKRDSLNMIKGLTPYQILEKLTSQTQEEESEVCWKEESLIKGQHFYQKIHNCVCRGEPMFIRALQGHSGKNQDMSRFSQRRLRKDTHHVCISLDFSRCEDSIKSGGPVPAGLGNNKGRKAAYFLPVPRLDPYPNPKYKLHFHMKIHQDRLFVIDQEAAQNSLEVHQAASGSVLCYDTVPAEFLTKTINMKDRSEWLVRGEFEEEEEEESSPTKRIRRDRGQPREASWHEVKQKTLETRQLGEFSSTAEILKENKSSEVHAQSNCCTKRNRLRTMFCRCGKKLGRLRASQEINAQMTIEKGSHVHSTTRTASNCRTSQTRTTPWCIIGSKVLGIDARPLSKMHKKRGPLSRKTNKRRSVSKVAWISWKKTKSTENK